MDFSFAVHKLEKFSSKTGKLQSEGLLHLLRYIRDNNTLGLKYYADMNDTPVSDLLIKASIKTENQLMDFSDYSWQDFPDTGKIKGAHTIFIKVGQFTIEHMFQDQFINLVHKVSTMKHALQEWLWNISGC